MHFATFADVTAHLDRLGLFHMDLGLDRMHKALDALHLRRTGVLARPVVQIVGTNGKGSTAHFLASVAGAHGLRAGVYTSPHLVGVTERIRIGGRPLPEDQWPGLAESVYNACPHLTYFEFLTVLAVLAFSRARVDLMILEAGLGGHYDATTAVEADLVCFTPIALDHMHILGPDLRSIATDKAQAMRSGTAAITVPQAGEALARLRAAAEDRGCTLEEASVMEPGIPLGLRGPHQRLNAGLAMAAWKRLARMREWTRDPDAERRGLAAAFIPGRIQHLSVPGLPPLIADGSHNGHGLEALIRTLREDGIRPGAVIFTCMEDKRVESLAPLIQSLGVPIVVPDLPGNSRAVSPHEAVAALGASATACRSLTEALELAAPVAARSNGPLLICGSLYLLGELFGLYPAFLEPDPAGTLDEQEPGDHV